ncbi:MAG: ATP-binding cassette domain-containing protein [Solobacterium sp.]|nr:ATP-binding cassette domain-containing protein [Solobacterium sp.]
MLTSAATVTLMGLTAVNGLTRESYMVFTTSYSMVISVASTVTGVMSNLFRMKNLADNVRPIFASKSDTKPNLEYVRHLNGRIRAENIHFSYEDESRGCLRGVSLNVRAGEKIAIVGESGCGKSTLLKILMGMETPDSGAVYFDDKDITLLNQKSLRQRIGSVFQFSKLFPGTIFSNVTFGATEEVSEEEVWSALDKACIGDYIRTLPLGINTEISESNSCGFSGGQRQRILIARALIGKPGVLILDEATSALDNMTQKKVLEAVNGLSCTVIMVAHRLSTVENCDKIIMLENGVIAEEGTYSELMERGGKFAKLVEKQLIKEEEEKQKKARPEPVLIA